MKEIKGDLIKLALAGEFDVIAHGCNTFCTMGAGIAPQMAAAFGCDKFPLEGAEHKGDVNKLGNIDFKYVESGFIGFTVINAYTQFGFGANHEGGISKPLDYTALELCFKKMNHLFRGKHIGLPWIGCGLAGGNIHKVRAMIRTQFKDCAVTLVEYQK